MVDKKTLIKVRNKYNGTVGYDVPDLKIHRNFFPGEEKEISFEELEKLSYTPGGDVILSDYLEIRDKDAVEQLFHYSPEPEYYYNKEDVIKLMQTGNLDQFLDCLDFSPASVKEMIKDLAVELPLNDVAKREAIKEKLGFDVSKAIEIKNTKYDGGAAADEGFGRLTNMNRRAEPVNAPKPAPTGRRYKPTT